MNLKEPQWYSRLASGPLRDEPQPTVAQLQRIQKEVSKVRKQRWLWKTSLAAIGFALCAFFVVAWFLPMIQTKPAVEEASPSLLARQVLEQYFDAVIHEQFEVVVQLYSGSYELLQSYNAEIDPENRVELMKAYCLINGGQLVAIDKIISSDKKSDEEYSFEVTFKNKDGSAFREGLPYTYTVKMIDGSYKVVELPPYLS